MIVVVGGIKGGSGKTTIATNLTIIRAKEGSDVLLIDADDQETATEFSILRNELTNDKAGYTCIKLTGKGLRTEVGRQVEKYDDIIIDTGGRDTASQRSALSIADIILVPFVPRSFDIWTLEKVASIAEEIRQINPGLKAFAFLNRADSRGSDNEDAIDMLKEKKAIQFLDGTICNRKAFGNAAAMGMSVIELKSQDPKATEEIMTLYNSIFLSDIDFVMNLTSNEKRV